jgi:hypothetical protein
MKIAQFLFNQSGTFIAPGKTGTCPRCNESTFTIAANDEVGRCTECGFQLIAEPPKELGVQRKFLLELAAVFYLALWRGSDRIAADTREFLTEALGLDERLLRGLGVGMIPENLDADRLLQLLPEKGKKDDAPSPREEAQEFLDELRLATNFIALPHTNAQHALVGWRALNRAGATREFRIARGCFGQSLAYPVTGKVEPALGERAVVVANEFDWLRIQTALLRSGFDPLPGCAVGAFARCDWSVLDWLSGVECRRPLIICDGTPHPAIASLASAAQDHLTVDAFQPAPGSPAPGSATVAQLFGEGRTPAEILSALVAAQQNAVTLYRPWDSLAKALYGIRVAHLGLSQEVFAHTQITELLVREFCRRGEFLRSGGFVYWRDRETNAIVDLTVSEDAVQKLFGQLKIVRSEQIYRYLGARLVSEGQQRGRDVTLRRFAHWDEERKTLYLDRRDGTMLRLDGESPPVAVPGGADDVLFLPLPEAAPFGYDAEMPLPPTSLWAEILLDKLNVTPDGALAPSDRRFLLAIFVLQLFFPVLARTKPIIGFVGTFGSGKSSAGKMIGRTLFGPTFDAVTVRKHDDVQTALTNSYLLLLDNCDDLQDRLDDLLAVAATGGVVKKRQLFTTNTLLSYPLNCFIMTSSQQPKFKRQDLADRTVPCRVERLPDFIGDSKLDELLVQRRDEIWSEVIDALRVIVRLLKQTPAGTQPSRLRLADFFDFGFRICKGLNLDKYWLSLITRLVRDQSEFSTTGSPVCEALKLWFAQKQNPTRPITTSDLYHELSALAQEKGIFWKYSAHTFGMILSNMVQALQQFYEVQTWFGHARAKYWCFSHRVKNTTDDAVVVAVPEPGPELKSPLLIALFRYAKQATEERRQQQQKEQAEAAATIGVAAAEAIKEQTRRVVEIDPNVEDESSKACKPKPKKLDEFKERGKSWGGKRNASDSPKSHTQTDKDALSAALENDPEFQALMKAIRVTKDKRASTPPAPETGDTEKQEPPTPNQPDGKDSKDGDDDAQAAVAS